MIFSCVTRVTYNFVGNYLLLVFYKIKNCWLVNSRITLMKHLTSEFSMHFVDVPALLQLFLPFVSSHF